MKRRIAAFLLSASLAFGLVQPIAHSQQQVMRRPIAANSFTTPSDIESIWEWWEPSRDTGTDGVGLQTLTGQKNGRNWTQATAGSRPLYDTTNALNGQAVIHCDARYYDGPDMTGIGSGTGSSKTAHVFIVVKADNYIESDINGVGLWKISSAGAGTLYGYSGTSGSIYETALQSARLDNIPPGTSLANWVVYEVSIQASSAPATADGSYVLKINGTQIGSANIVGMGFSATPLLGRTNDSGNQWFFKGRIAGMYLFSALLGSTDRTNLINYIDTRFGLSAS